MARRELIYSNSVNVQRKIEEKNSELADEKIMSTAREENCQL